MQNKNNNSSYCKRRRIVDETRVHLTCSRVLNMRCAGAKFGATHRDSTISSTRKCTHTCTLGSIYTFARAPCERNGRETKALTERRFLSVRLTRRSTAAVFDRSYPPPALRLFLRDDRRRPARVVCSTSSSAALQERWSGEAVEGKGKEETPLSTEDTVDRV